MQQSKSLKLLLLTVVLVIYLPAAFTFEKRISIEKRVVITDQYLNIPQYPDNYFFVDSHKEIIDGNEIHVKSRTLLRFNLNELANKKITKAELIKNKDYYGGQAD